MSNPYIGEIRMFAGNFPPVGWAFCNGQLMAISENDTLFNLIGTTYGGDGQNTFALPDLQGRVPLHQGGGHTIGEMGGTEQETLTVNQIPSHNHAALCSSTTGTLSSPLNATWAPSSTGNQMYASPPNPYSDAAMHPNSIAPDGGSQPHENMGPYLCVTFIISLYGIYPTPT